MCEVLEESEQGDRNVCDLVVFEKDQRSVLIHFVLWLVKGNGECVAVPRFFVSVLFAKSLREAVRPQKKRVGCERRKILFFKLLFVFVEQKLFVVLGTFAADGGLKKPLPHSFRSFGSLVNFVQSAC